jgi:hypothetical protein
MKTYLYILAISAIALGGVRETFAQTTSVSSRDITWRSGELTDKSNNMRLTQTHTLDTHNKSYIELHRGTEQTLRFNVNSVSGTWTDEKTDGKLVYNVTSTNGVPGVITISKSGSLTKALIDFTQTNKNGLNIELVLSGNQ